jgi:hypothetical protein
LRTVQRMRVNLEKLNLELAGSSEERQRTITGCALTRKS